MCMARKHEHDVEQKKEAGTSASGKRTMIDRGGGTAVPVFLQYEAIHPTQKFLTF